MPAKYSIVDVARLADGRLVAAGTTRRANALWQLASKVWSPLVEWKGKEVTACCGVGDAVVCAALDGELYAWSAGQLQKHTIPDPTMWIYAASALDDMRAVLGGSGGLVFFDPHTGAVDHRRLSTYEISKPGRIIHGINRSAGRLFIVGAKNMVLELQGDALVELANRATFGGQELMFLSAEYCNDRLWLSGFGQLASLDAGGPQVYENVGERTRAMGLGCHQGELLVFQNEILLGEPGHWRPLVEGFHAEGLIAVEPIGDDQLCAITYTGKSYFLQGDVIELAPIF
jgi:hypothetical protein